jgi:hypothetical protein
MDAGGRSQSPLLHHCRKVWVVVATAVLLGGPGFAGQTVLFSDDCSGPALSPAWVASLPNASLAGDRSPEAAFLGAPSFLFKQLNGRPALRLANTLDRYQRRGWSSSDTFSAPGFRFEVRFNTLIQSSQSSIDAFIEIWVFDAASPRRHDILSPFGANFSSNRRFFSGSSIDDDYVNQSVEYRDHTWYRLVLEGAPGRNLRASLCTDAGRELVGRELQHGADTFKCGFRIGLSQAMGDPFTGPSPSQVAIGSVTLTEIPRPSVDPEK